ncbi:MAG TPA: hypothetical protein VJ821_11970 [Anaerolineales bacterium]|nr:hypothetical protein [Anaerolineales bacterium]
MKYLSSKQARTSTFFTSNIASIIWAIIVACLVGCAPESESQATITPGLSLGNTPPSTQAVTQTLVTHSVQETETGLIVQRLANSKWQQVRSPDPNLAPETITWEFYANGMFRWQFTSDFLQTNTGAWAISPISEESGLLYLASTTIVPPRFDVLSLILQNGVLKLGEFTYQETPFTDTDVPPGVQGEDRQAVTDQRDRFFSLWVTMTDTDWRSEAPPAPGDANLYSLMQTGTYRAEFDDQQCQYSGTWSLSFSENDSGIIRLSVPENACDRRGEQQAFVREIPFRLESDTLVLSETVYIPIPRSP